MNLTYDYISNYIGVLIWFAAVKNYNVADAAGSILVELSVEFPWVAYASVACAEHRLR